MRRSRWLARLAAILVVGVAGLVVAASAPAQAGPAIQANVGLGSGIIQLSAGGAHVLALKSNGTMLARGNNNSASSAPSTPLSTTPATTWAP